MPKDSREQRWKAGEQKPEGIISAGRKTNDGQSQLLSTQDTPEFVAQQDLFLSYPFVLAPDWKWWEGQEVPHFDLWLLSIQRPAPLSGSRPWCHWTLQQPSMNFVCNRNQDASHFLGGSRAQKYCLSFFCSNIIGNSRGIFMAAIWGNGEATPVAKSISSISSLDVKQSQWVLFLEHLLQMGRGKMSHSVFHQHQDIRPSPCTHCSPCSHCSQPLLTLLSLISAPPNPADHPAVWALKLQMTQCAACRGNPEVSIKSFH